MTGAATVRRVAVVAAVAALSVLGILNVALKAAWAPVDDGVLWRGGGSGVVADRLADGSPAADAGILVGDRLIEVDGTAVHGANDPARILERSRPGASVRYVVERGSRRLILSVPVRQAYAAGRSLYYYLAAIGFLSLAVGATVLLRRPRGRGTRHLFAVCVLIFLTYTVSYTGKLDALDWAFLWIDHLAALFLPVVFLHFCLVFPERRDPARRVRLVPLLYALPLGVALTGATATAAFRATRADIFWQVVALIDHATPIYFGILYAFAFFALLKAYRTTHRARARKQIKWLVWGTGAGVLPFLLFYAVPFTFGARPSIWLELAGYLPLALIPLSLAYALVEHRLLEVELAFRRGLVYLLAVLALAGACLLVVQLLEAGLTGEESLHTPIIAVLCTLIVLSLFTPVKRRIQEAVDRLSYRERYASRKALLHLSQEINADLDLGRISERLVSRVADALGVDRIAVFLPDEKDAGAFRAFRSVGCAEAEAARLPAGGEVLRQLGEGRSVTAEMGGEPALACLGLAYLFPCRGHGSLIAVLGVGRAGMDPLNSEEVDLMRALAGQVATALMNARLYRSLSEKASELERLTQYSESILESLDSGIVVLDLDGRVVRWNRAMEMLTGEQRAGTLGKPLDVVFPSAFLGTLSDRLVLGRGEEIGHVYKVSLPTRDGRDPIVNVAVAPFQMVPGERAGTILIVGDVTDRMHLEEQLQHADKMASIGLLAAGVAHEVNTPLAGISSYAQMLREQMEGADPRAHLLDKIEKQSFRAAKIIGSLLNFSRSAGLELGPVDLNRAILDVLSLSEHQMAAAHIKVRRELAEELSLVQGNASRLQQVFFNLIQNARDAMPNGGWLTLATWSEGEAVVAEVRDTGDGIQREHLQRIYDPFFTTKGLGRGTGLGLSVAYGIVQDHRGTISVESVPQRGTTFRVSLPALAAPSAARRG